MRAPPELDDLPRPTYFFDGYCVLCSGFVAFCLKRDPAGRLKFATTQSALGQRVVKALGLPEDTLDRTVLMLEGQSAYLRSTAALHAMRYLRGPARALVPLLLIPAALRDPIYDLVARNRYKWFGQRPNCFMPTPQTRDRFLDL